jgi:hypothetical protein
MKMKFLSGAGFNEISVFSIRYMEAACALALKRSTSRLRRKKNFS